MPQHLMLHLVTMAELPGRVGMTVEGKRGHSEFAELLDLALHLHNIMDHLSPREAKAVPSHGSQTVPVLVDI